MAATTSTLVILVIAVILAKAVGIAALSRVATRASRAALLRRGRTDTGSHVWIAWWGIC